MISTENEIIYFDGKKSIAKGLLKLAMQFPKSKIVWCHENYQEYLNLDGIKELFHHNKMMLSYHPNEINFLGEKIGYVEESPFIKINKKVTYPTWQMSSLVGVIHASVLLAIKDEIKLDLHFDYYLNSVAKVCMPLGLFCYSEPKLLLEQKFIDPSKPSCFPIFKFVKQHYKTRWVLLLLLNLMIYERRFPVFAFFNAMFFKNRNESKINIDSIRINSSLKVDDKGTIDVIIPTIGRKKYLHDVLKDLAKQTHLPINVIIVEQNPVANSVSDLDFLNNEDWPFIIKHTFTHQAGACNARNIALEQIESEWVFLADDDIRITNYFLEKAFDCICKYKNDAFTFNCLQENEKTVYEKIFQWPTFGSGCSIVARKNLKNCMFSKSYEFGFGEDADFGMLLRNHGFDVLYLPNPKILHLKAPIGGFRTKPELQWQNESVQPKPSPTVMLFKISHNSNEQLLGYKTILFFKYYKYQKIKNPIKYFMIFQKQWEQSLLWANELKKTS